MNRGKRKRPGIKGKENYGINGVREKARGKKRDGNSFICPKCNMIINYKGGQTYKKYCSSCGIFMKRIRLS